MNFMKTNFKRKFIRPLEKRKTGMNKLEAKYALTVLEPLLKAGEIIKYRYEAIKLKLANNTTYTPDFYVVYPGHIEFHETKGRWMDDARVKIKVAAEMYSEYRFLGVKWNKKKWEYEEF